MVKAARTICGECGDAMAKAHRVYEGVPYCGPCYFRDFRVLPCSRCSKPARVYRLKARGLCRTCDRITRKCIRCKGGVPKAALVLPQGAVCPNCRRYFKPELKRSPPSGEYATCSCCHKHRPVRGHSLQRRPLCRRCIVTDRSEEAAQAQAAYWLKVLRQRARTISRPLRHEWSRRAFCAFAEWSVSRSQASAVVPRLPRYLEAMRKLDETFGSVASIDATSLLKTFTTAELRQSEMLFSFLQASGLSTPDRDDTESQADRKRIAGYFREAQSSPYVSLLTRYARQSEVEAATPVSIRTLRLKLRAATSLLVHVGDGRLDQALVEAYLLGTPGHRAVLSSFVTFLRGEGIHLRLPPKPAATRKAPPRIPIQACLEQMGRSQSLPELRAAFAGGLAAKMRIPLEQLLRLERQQLEVSGHDSWLVFQDRRIPIDPLVGWGAQRYVAVRDPVAGDQGPLFCGRPLTQRANSQTITRYWQTWSHKQF